MKKTRAKKNPKKVPAPTSGTEAIVQPGEVLCLRTCDKDLKAHGGFQWSESGIVKAPDWDSEPECGNGLHGLLWGEGDGGLLNWDKDARWLVVAVKEKDIVHIGQKVKFPECRVVHVGNQKSATDVLVQYAPKNTAVVGASITAGDYGKAAAGDYGQATAGYYGQATAGYYGQATAGSYGQATAGYAGQATAGYAGQATAGDDGQATAGYAGRATAGYAGRATAGYAGRATAGANGQATAGDDGQATAGYAGRATAGYAGRATAGANGIIVLSYWDAKSKRSRLVVGYPGEGGIAKNTLYKLDADFKLVEVK